MDDSDVDDTGANTGIRYLRRSRLYTVTRTYVLSSGPGVNLQEIDRPYSYEGFRAERFRPAIEHEEDISVLLASSKPQADPGELLLAVRWADSSPACKQAQRAGAG